MYSNSLKWRRKPKTKIRSFQSVENHVSYVTYVMDPTLLLTDAPNRPPHPGWDFVCLWFVLPLFKLYHHGLFGLCAAAWLCIDYAWRPDDRGKGPACLEFQKPLLISNSELSGQFIFSLVLTIKAIHNLHRLSIRLRVDDLIERVL